jgi:hypothetical protein
MHFKHRGIEYTLEDDWWAEAGMTGFRPSRRSYRAGPSEFQDLVMFEVAIDDVQPLNRKATHGVFKDSGAGRREGSARDRVVRILKWFRDDAPVEPVCVARLTGGAGCRFKLIHGAHRFYCAVAAGYSHIPAVEVKDIWAAAK